jgi:hypothetical protein
MVFSRITSSHIALVSFVGLVVFVSQARAQTPVTACNAHIDDGVLTGDLDCSTTPGVSITISGDGKLDLAGFTLTGGPSSAIVCEGNCTIEGNGGTVRGAGANGIAADGGRISVANVTLEDNGYAGVLAAPSTWTGTVSVSNSTVRNNAWGVIARRISLRDSMVTGQAAAGLGAHQRVDIVNSEVSFNGRSALQATDRCKVEVVNSSIEGNGTSGTGNGIAGKVASVAGSTIINNWGGGLWAQSLRIEQSTVTGNDVGPGCDPITCADLTAAKLRFRAGVTCDTSAVIEKSGAYTGGTWGVCAAD